ncbi:MAG: hypothetical protein AAF939_03725 [Planctomycetota bacterium]
MSDDLFEYFGSGSKKVEPIEDDDLLDNEPEVEAQDSAVKDVDSPVAPSEVAIEAAETGSESVAEEPSLLEDVSVADTSGEETEEEPAKGGHWDFLANMLGIGGGKQKSKSSSVKKVASKLDPEEVEIAAEESDSKALESVEASELKSKDSAILDEMFAAEDSKVIDHDSDPEPVNISSADDLIGWVPVKPKAPGIDKEEDEQIEADEQAVTNKPRRSRKSKKPQKVDKTQEVVTEAFDSDDTEDEFVEFEIEELDKSPVDEDEAAARGRSRRRRSRSERSRSNEDSDDRPRRRGPSKKKVASRDSDDWQDNELIDDFDSEDDESEDVQLEPTRKRRRRGPKRARREKVELEFDDESDEFDSDDDDDIDQEGSDDDLFEEERPRRRGRRSSRDKDSRSNRDREAIDEEQKKRGQVPTWEETITVIVESNIKNHKKASGGGNRRGGRSRKR